MTLCAKPPVMIEPYYEFVVAVLLSPAIIYCALWFEPMVLPRRSASSLA
jgi:hypothetical protein